MIIKHLYQRTLKTHAKPIKAWYFWYKDNHGKIIRRSCGSSRNPCTLKKEALAFIQNLKDEDLIPDEEDVFTLNDFASGMFSPGSKFLIKEKNRGTIYSEATLKGSKHYLEVILERWGKVNPANIDGADIENWLLEFDKSASWRNNVITIFEKIFSEMESYKIIKYSPKIPHFKRSQVSKKGVLTKQEIESLFPISHDHLSRIWSVDDNYGFMFALMYYMTVTMGLRSGEIRAIKEEQIKGDYLLLSRSFNAVEKEVDHLKKGDDDNKKWRIVIIPERVKLMLNDYLLIRNKNDEYLFTYEHHPVSGNYFNKRFKKILTRNGINCDLRNISVHSLRFTCNTLVRHHIPEDILRYMIGHTTKNMTDYYDKSDIDMRISLLESQKSAFSMIWK